MEFSEWITEKYIAWRGKAIGNERSITDFSKWIGVSQSLMSQWMKKGGKIPRSTSSIQKLVDAFGIEVYDILNLPRPESESPFEQLPAPFKERLEAAMTEVNARYQREGISPESDADGEKALEIAREVFDKYGIDINISEADDDGS